MISSCSTMISFSGFVSMIEFYGFTMIGSGSIMIGFSGFGSMMEFSVFCSIIGSSNESEESSQFYYSASRSTKRS